MRGEDNPMFGVPKSEETKRKLRDSKTGKKASDSTRELMSIQRTGEGNNMYGKEGEESPTFGNQWWVNKDLNIETFMKESPGEGWELGRKGVSEETSQKISESTRGERNPMFGRTGENSPAWGKVWWVNKETNDEKLDKKCPGPGWVEGRKEKTESARKKHSEANIGKKWWVNSDGDTKFDLESPGEEWQEGRKWK
jgi:hypothetical protein